MDFTFGVLTYNSEKYILDNLESIKYQMQHYADGRSCQLIVSDDASGDNTVMYIKKWIEVNRGLFANVKILVSDKNLGTVKNYHKLFHEIEGKNFHVIAGDDMFSNLNLFDMIDLLSSYDIITSFPICLNEKGIFIDDNRLQRHLYRMNHKPYTSKELVENEMFGSFLHTPSTIFRKNLYDSEVETFVNQFLLYEDDPKWFCLLKKTNKIKFILYPIVIYRYHSESVCHPSKQNVRKTFLDDMLKLIDCYLSICDNCWLKIYLWLRKHAINTGSKFNLANMCRWVEGKIVRGKSGRNKANLELKCTIQKYAQDMEKFYSEIHNTAKSFM